MLAERLEMSALADEDDCASSLANLFDASILAADLLAR
jgi:hypothetical protein